MTANWTVFVEGDSDEVLIKALLNFLKGTNIKTRKIGGGVYHLEFVVPQIVSTHDAGDRVAMILDANSNKKQRAREVDRAIKRLDLPVDRYFLLPNDHESGSLETLLEHMAVSEHKAVYQCLEQYGHCLRSRNPTYQPPDPKGRVYAYCEALGIETRDSKRDFTDSTHWNLDSPVLDPLKRFLSGL